MKPSNKGHRETVAKQKQRNRLIVLGLLNQEGKFHVFKHHGKPCSCRVCKRPRYNRAKEFVDNFIKSQVDIDSDVVDMINENFWDLV